MDLISIYFNERYSALKFKFLIFDIEEININGTFSRGSKDISGRQTTDHFSLSIVL